MPLNQSIWNLFASQPSQASIVPDKGIPPYLAKNQIPAQEMMPQPNPQTGMAEGPRVSFNQSQMVRGLPQIEPEQNYQAEFEKLYKEGLDQRSTDLNKQKAELAGLKAPDQFQSMDLSPLLAWAGNLSGKNIGQGYSAPTVKKEFEAKRAGLQDSISKNQAGITDDQLGYLKMKADEKKNEEMMALRELMSRQRGQGKDASMEDKLRSQYLASPIYKTMAEISNAYQAIASNPAENGPAQQALVYQFSRILDPGSVVRETEYAMSAANAGKYNQAKMYYQKLASGQALSPEQVKLMKEVSANLVQSARKMMNRQNDVYRNMANRRGVDPEMVIADPFEGMVGEQAHGPSGLMGFDQWKAQKAGQ